MTISRPRPVRPLHRSPPGFQRQQTPIPSPSTLLNGKRKSKAGPSRPGQLFGMSGTIEQNRCPTHLCWSRGGPRHDLAAAILLLKILLNVSQAGIARLLIGILKSGRYHAKTLQSPLRNTAFGLSVDPPLINMTSPVARG